MNESEKEDYIGYEYKEVTVPSEEVPFYIRQLRELMTYSQHTLIGSGGYFPEDVEDVISVMASHKWDIESIITHEYPWEELPQAIERLHWWTRH